MARGREGKEKGKVEGIRREGGEKEKARGRRGQGKKGRREAYMMSSCATAAAGLGTPWAEQVHLGRGTLWAEHYCIPWKEQVHRGQARYEALSPKQMPPVITALLPCHQAGLWSFLMFPTASTPTHLVNCSQMASSRPPTW